MTLSTPSAPAESQGNHEPIKIVIRHDMREDTRVHDASINSPLDSNPAPQVTTAYRAYAATNQWTRLRRLRAKTRHKRPPTRLTQPTD
jgi:hypothetical protein